MNRNTSPDSAPDLSTPDLGPGYLDFLAAASARLSDFCDPDIWAGDLSPAGIRNRRTIDALRAAMAGRFHPEPDAAASADSSGQPDLNDPATLWAVYRRAQAAAYPDLPDPTPEEFRAAADEVTAKLWRDGQ